MYADRHWAERMQAVCLDLSESPFNPPEQVIASVSAELQALNRYPCPGSYRLAARLGEKHRVQQDQILVGNGADELLLVAALTFLTNGSLGITTRGTFRGYAAAFRMAGARAEFCPLDGFTVNGEVLAEKIAGARLAIVCNPLNPTGTILTQAHMERLAMAAKESGARLLFDEAYAEFAELEGFVSALELVRQGFPVIVTRTFSKYYGLAGLRCGYAVASSEIIKDISKVKDALPFNTNRLAQSAALAALDCQAIYDSRARATLETRDEFVREMAIRGLVSPKSYTNYVFLDISTEAGTLCLALQKGFGIHVRDGAAFGFPHHIRVSVGTAAQMERMAAALQKLL